MMQLNKQQLTQYFILISLSIIVNLTKSPQPAKAEEIIGCVNGSSITKTDYERLMQSEFAKFTQDNLFDPWKNASLENTKARQKLIEFAKAEKTLVVPDEVRAYKNEFNRKLTVYGEAPNTYDLEAYARDNALLKQHFRQQNFTAISNALIDKALLLQHARNVGLIVTPEETEQRLNLTKAKYGSAQAFNQFLQNFNSNEQAFRVALQEQILVEKLKAWFFARLIMNKTQAQEKNLPSKSNDLEPQNNYQEEYLNWLNSLKAKSQLAFSLNPQDPELLICLRNNPNFQIPGPKGNFPEAENLNNMPPTTNNLNKKKFINTDGMKKLWQSSKDKFKKKK